MKLLKTISISFIFCLVSIVQAQTNQYPSQERVEKLFNEIESCKTLLKKAEKEISDMENAPNAYTLAQYKAAQASVKRLKHCINVNRGELAKIKKVYPEWFNAPNSIISLRDGTAISPHILEDNLMTLEDKLKWAIERHNSLKKPQ
ncbi:hypothetical protein [Seonamhaeicola sp.]|uniref:hypothetical protein n=1 Tax=Seonamhaeicola sp. TaxID=1912245 RepID=UPI00260B468C|nr:hypothetical protein [Seonamhaeicola sp.]